MCCIAEMMAYCNALTALHLQIRVVVGYIFRQTAPDIGLNGLV